MIGEELAEILERVEEAKPFGHGVAVLALDDVPKLVAEIKYLREGLEYIAEGREHGTTYNAVEIAVKYLEEALK